MRKLTLLLTLSIAYTAGHAQYLNYNRYEILNRSQLPILSSIDNQYEDIKGEAFYSAQWLPGKVITANGKQYEDLTLKIDFHANKLYAKIHDTVFDLTSSPFSSFQVLQTNSDPKPIAVFKKGISLPGTTADQFFQVLEEGSLTLVKQRNLAIKEIHEDLLSTSKKFFETDNYFILKKDESNEAVRLTKENLQQITGNKWDEISQYIKTAHLSPSKETGWIAAINYYNTHQ